MNKVKRLILILMNIVKFRNVHDSNTRRILRRSLLGLHIELEKGGKLILTETCPICRKNCVFTVRSKGMLQMGSNVFFNRNCMIAVRESVKIGNDCLFGPNVCIFDHDHRFDENSVSRTEFTTGKVSIGDHVWVGANVTILKGVTIGENSIIGAGCVVTGDVPANTILVQKKENVYLSRFEK